MKVLLIQFEPKFKDPEGNRLKAVEMIDRNQNQADFIVLPEMIFTGYCFRDRQDMLPFTEGQDGETFKWASRVAMRRKCFIQVGYPSKNGESDPKLYNSVMLVSPEGKLVVNYDKHFLYETDETWAEEGPSFKTVQVGQDGRFSFNVGFGICMDLSPYQFKANFDAFEFGNFQADNDADLILCSMAWLHPNQNFGLDGDQKAGSNDDEIEYRMMNYWALRLTPLIMASKNKPIVVVICNRIGREVGSLNKATLFGGSSCVLKFDNGKVTLLGNLSSIKEGCLFVEFDLKS